MGDNLSRKILTVILTLVTVLGTVSTWAVSAGATEANDTISKIISAQYTPTDEEAQSNTNPYGLSPDASDPTLMLKAHEVFLYKTTKYKSNLNGENGIYNAEYTLPNFTVNRDGTMYSSDDLDRAILGRGSTRGQSGSNVLVNLSGLDQSPTYFTRLAAIDPNGSGRDNYVAQLYVEKDSKNEKTAVLRIINAQTGEMSNKVMVQIMNWIPSDGFAQATLNNYLAIVGGDFDGDGKDEVAVYAAGDDNNSAGVSIFKVKTGAQTLYGTNYNVTVSYSSSISYSDISNDENGEISLDKITCSLAAADLDGQKGDELVICTGTNYRDDIHDNEDNVADVEHNVSRVTVWKNGKKIRDWNTVALENEDKLTSTYKAIQSGAISVGDVDGDGNKEIIVVGYRTMITLDYKEKETKRYGLYNYKADENERLFEIAVIRMSQPNGMLTGISDVMQTALINGGLHMDYRSYNCIFPMLMNECVAVNGANAPELLFVGGSFYSLSGADPKLVYSIENYADEEVGDLDRRYIESVTVGNFAHDSVGCEQVMFTVGWKTSEEDQYSYKLVLAGVSDNRYYSIFCAAGTDDYDDRKTTMGLYNEDGELYDDEPGVNYVPVAVDTDNDGLMIGYVGKNYAYSDPEVIAVLQAAPYFGEIGFEGETEYSISTTYAKTKTETDSVSFGVGITAEWQAGKLPAYKGGFELGYALDWEQSFEREWETTYTDTFKAGALDSVVIQRTLVGIYVYRVWDNEKGNWGKTSDGSPMIIYLEVPMQPIYYTLSVDEYNEFVEQYEIFLGNKEVESNLIKVDSSIIPTNAEGNPQNYYHSWADAGMGGKAVSKNTYGLSTNGGSITSSMEESYSETSGSSMSHGFHFHTQHGAGFEVGSTEASVQIYFDLDYSHGGGTYETNGNTKGSSGTVSNLSVSDDLPKEIADQYRFNWQFGEWKRSLQTDTDGKKIYIPVLGYVTSDVEAPAAPVNDLNTSISNGVATLSWSDPNELEENEWRKNRGFNIYLERGGRLEKVNKSIVTDCSFEYTADIDEILLSFTVRPIHYDTKREGISSNTSQVINLRVMKDGITPQLHISEESNEWEVSYDGGTTWAALGVIAKGENGKDGLNGVSVSSAEIVNGELIFTLSNGQTINIGSIIGSSGSNGADGKNGKDGVNGKNGTDGRNGADGKNGTDGINGINGTDGKDGADGKDGLNGRDGTDGKDGVGVSQVKFDKDGNLIVDLNDGSSINAGQIPSKGTNKGFISLGIGIAVLLAAWNLVNTIRLARKKDI